MNKVRTNKGFLINENISIKCNVEIITDNTKLVVIFNTHSINTVKKSSGTPNMKGNPENPLEDGIIFKNFLKKYQNQGWIQRF